MAEYPGLGIEVLILPGTGTPFPNLAQILVGALPAEAWINMPYLRS